MAAQEHWRQSPKGQAIPKTYAASDAGKAINKAYEASDAEETPAQTPRQTIRCPLAAVQSEKEGQQGTLQGWEFQDM